ncbi:hypothetical protein ACLOJK_011681 [Asimina triloba]
MEEGKKAYRAHVLCLPFPSQGHINPMLQFAKRLVSKGIKATVATTIFVTKSAKFSDSSGSIEHISDGCDQGGYAEAGSIEAYLERLEAVGSKTLSDLIERSERCGDMVAGLVYDAGLTWALDGLPPLEISDMPSIFSASGFQPSNLPLVMKPFSNISKADWVLLNTFDKLEPEQETNRPHCAVRVPDDRDYNINLLNPETRACIKWLDERATGAVVYISFGSVATLGVEQTEEVGWGLMMSKQHFLWVVKDTEEEKFPHNIKDSTEDMGLIVPWEVMEGVKSEEFKRNASKWRDLAREALDEGGSSDQNIQEFVISILKNDKPTD